MQLMAQVWTFRYRRGTTRQLGREMRASCGGGGGGGSGCPQAALSFGGRFKQHSRNDKTTEVADNNVLSGRVWPAKQPAEAVVPPKAVAVPAHEARPGGTCKLLSRPFVLHQTPQQHQLGGNHSWVKPS